MFLLLQTTLASTQSPGIISGGFIDVGVKWLFLALFFFYVVFAFVVTRQVTIMRKTLITPFSPVLTTVGYIHLAVAIIFFVFFLLVL